MSANVQRRETHSCIGGASPSACRFGRVSELTTRSTTSPLPPRTGSAIEQRGYSTHRSCQVSWFLGTSVAFTCSDDYDPSRQPRPLLQSSRVSLLADQTRLERLGSKQTGEPRSRANRL